MRFKPYRLALKNPLSLPGTEPLRFREGILVYRPDTDGWGDAAPLPGYSTETFADLKEAVQSPDPDVSNLPSLRFAYECAEKAFCAPDRPIKVNALWIVEKENVPEVLFRLREWVKPVIKVKPGNPPRVDKILEFVAQRPDCRLRVDGNRQWSLEQTLWLFHQLPAQVLEYIEEPLADPGDYPALWSREELPIALDESLLFPGGEALLQFQGVKALILKPTLLGNAADRAVWIRRASARNLKVVWSSCFESGVGLWHLARLAQHDGIAGLDTGGVFEQDLLTPRPVAVKGLLCPPEDRSLHLFENGLEGIQD